MNSHNPFSLTARAWLFVQITGKAFCSDARPKNIINSESFWALLLWQVPSEQVNFLWKAIFKMTSTNFDNHYNEFFFFSNTMNLHQIHISYRIWNWTTHEPWISLFGNHFRVENIFGKNIHLLTTLRQIIHETKDFGIDFVIHNALKKNKTDFSLFTLFRKMKALPCTDFLENLWNDSHTKSFFGEQ